MWHRILAAVATVMLLGCLGGCASMGKPLAMRQPFDAAAAARIHVEGKASISGQAFVRQSSGKLLRAVGTDIYLIPRTAYSDERMAAVYGEGNTKKWGRNLADADPAYEEYMRKTVASSGGSFRFDRVADGGYYVVAMIFVPGEYSGFEFPILERVTVKGGRSVKVVMRGY